MRMVAISEEMAVEKLASETRVVALRFAYAYEQMTTDIAMLSLLPPLQGIIRSSNQQGVDPLDGSSIGSIGRIYVAQLPRRGLKQHI